MAYDSGQARQELLDEVASATDDIGVALAALGAAFEVLDDYNAERLEEELFRPIQSAYGRAQRTHSEFAERHGLPTRRFDSASAGLPSQGVKGFLDAAGQRHGARRPNARAAARTHAPGRGRRRRAARRAVRGCAAASRPYRLRRASSCAD